MKFATLEIRERAVYLYLFEGYTYDKLEKIFNYSAAVIKKWVASYRKGELWVIKQRGHRPSVLNENDYQFISDQIRDTNHITIMELTKLLGKKCGKSTVHSAMRKMGLTYKKNSAR